MTPEESDAIEFLIKEWDFGEVIEDSGDAKG
jgi:hypothetical protein